jgi:hypothetical protein
LSCWWWWRSSLILPGLARAREYAYFTSCKNSQRQMIIACLCFAANNRGAMPYGDQRCNGGGSGVGGPCAGLRRIGTGPGSYVGHWNHLTPGIDAPEIDRCADVPWTSGWRSKRLAMIVQDLYGGEIALGQNWQENLNGSNRGPWMGFARQPGKYLPIDAFWDPIVVVRRWQPWGSGSAIKWNSGYCEYDPPELDGQNVHPGTERGRDHLTRRTPPVAGYELFLYTVGCIEGIHDLNLATGDGSVRSSEQPFRYATRSKPLMTQHKPSAWVASCCRPKRKFKHTYDPNLLRNFASHFGCREVSPMGWRFNVVHLDGHVDDGMWTEYHTEDNAWMFARPGPYWMDNTPYGWRFKDYSGVDGAKKGMEIIPGFPRAFDENR